MTTCPPEDADAPAPPLGGNGGAAPDAADDAPEAIPAWASRVYAQPSDIMPLPLAKSRPPSPAAELTRAGIAPKSGILNIDKPAGRTSHDIVNAVRRASGERRVGHAGTLDPMATGVLVVCIGSATRVVDDVQAFTKGYRARITLGSATDSYDATGQVTFTGDAAAGRDLLAEVEQALSVPGRDHPGAADGVGPQARGTRLYELARRGVEVERRRGR
ncbi:MAG: hypothetical protein U0470_14585 [Anaerolineae bacterium]